MNTTGKSRRTEIKKTILSTPTTLSDQFEEMPDPLSVVEHLTIPGFIRRAPHRFHIEEMMRFGDKVGKVAESLQISYLTTIDRQLGQIRLFPVPLLDRVYQVMAAQFGWESTLDVPTVEDRQSEMRRANEKARKHLQLLINGTENVEVLEALTKIVNWIDSDGKTTAPDPHPPLRSI